MWDRIIVWKGGKSDYEIPMSYDCGAWNERTNSYF